MRLFLYIYVLLISSCSFSTKNSKMMSNDSTLYSYSVDSIRIDDSVSMIAYWKKGEKFFYELEKSKKETVNGKVVKEEENLFTVSFEVIEQTDSQYVIKYKYEDLDEKKSSQLPMRENIISRFEYEIETSNMGEYLGIRNWEEIKDKAQEVIRLLKDSKYTSKEESDKTRAFTNNLFSNKINIETIISGEVSSLYEFYGYTFPVNQSIDFEVNIPNFPIMDAPLIGKSKMRFEWLNDTDVKEEINLSYDPQITKQAFLKTEQQQGRVIKDTINLSYKIKDLAFQITDMETGWFKEYEQNRTIIVKQNGVETIRENVTRFKRKDN